MAITKNELTNNFFVGVVEENNDPQKKGRCRVRVTNVFDNISIDDIPWAKPWKDLGGNVFSVPEKGKVVSVIFDKGSIYRPEYICAEHYNVNLQSKLEKLSEKDYPTFKSVMIDHSTQIYRSESEGLYLDHEYSNINLDEVGNISVNLRNNSVYLKIGTNDASQQAVLGNHFLNWMDKLIDALSGTPYVGNLYVSTFPSPSLKPILAEYRSGRQSSKFLSKNVFIVDNKKINTIQRDYLDQDGDDWKSTTTDNKVTKVTPTKPNIEPDSPPATEPLATINENKSPESDNVAKTVEEAQSENEAKQIVVTGNPNAKELAGNILSRNVDNEGSALGAQSIKKVLGKYKNGRIPYKEVFKISERLKSDQPGKLSTNDKDKYHHWWLYPPFAEAIDALMDDHDKADYPGKYLTTKLSDGYRTFLRQEEMKGTKNEKLASLRAVAGTSPHGVGNAVDIGWGLNILLSDDTKTYMGAIFRHPTYQWFWHNGYKYGIYNPFWARNGVKNFEEWWHWEYDPTQNKKYPTPDSIPKYSGPFTLKDWNTLMALEGCNVKYMESTIKKYGFILLYDKQGNYLYDQDGNFTGSETVDKKGNYLK